MFVSLTNIIDLNMKLLQNPKKEKKKVFGRLLMFCKFFANVCKWVELSDSCLQWFCVLYLSKIFVKETSEMNSMFND
jgi:hypothetical protein